MNAPLKPRPTQTQEPLPVTDQTRRGAVIEFAGVSKTYGAVTALHPTSLSIAAGEFFAIIGPSGSGKTTLLGITAGFVPPSGGHIEVDGRDVTAIPPYRRDFGMVFQNYALFPHMTVAENIAFPLKMRGLPKAEIAARVARMLDMVRLPGFGDRRLAQMSGGQQQRVALARAAIYDPVLLLMDEPLGALDKNLREEMQEEIKGFQRQLGATVIYVTHDQQEAAFMADRLAIMRAGRIEQIGSPRDLYERPRSTFVAGFLGEASLLPVTDLVAGPEGSLSAAIGAGLRVTGMAPPEGPVATLCLRPESLRLGADAEGAENLLQAQVEDVVYTTGSVRYRLRLEGVEAVVVARAPTRPDMDLHAPGTRLAVGWSRRDTIFL